MEKVLSYSIDAGYMKSKGEGLANLLKQWLNENNIDAIVNDFTLGDFSSLLVDFSFDNNAKVQNVQILTEQFLERFNINYELEVEQY